MLSADTIEILNKIHAVLKNENIRVSLTQSAKAGIISGLCTMAGGLLGGKTGVTIGGVAGTLINHYMTEEFVSLVHVIQHELTDEEKTSMAQQVQEVMQTANSTRIVETVLNYVRTLGYETCSSPRSRQPQEHF